MPEGDERFGQPVDRAQQAIAEGEDQEERQPLEQPDAGDSRLGQDVGKKPIQRDQIDFVVGLRDERQRLTGEQPHRR